MELVSVRFLVRPMFRGGVELPQRQFESLAPLLCELGVASIVRPEYGKAVRYCSAFKPGDAHRRELLPPLWWPKLATLGPHGFRLDGYELHKGKEPQVQAWSVRFAK